MNTHHSQSQRLQNFPQLDYFVGLGAPLLKQPILRTFTAAHRIRRFDDLRSYSVGCRLVRLYECLGSIFTPINFSYAHMYHTRRSDTLTIPVPAMFPNSDRHCFLSGRDVSPTRSGSVATWLKQGMKVDPMLSQ
jgi:hypothetical protein